MADRLLQALTVPEKKRLEELAQIQGQSIEEFCLDAVKEYIQTLLDNPERLKDGLLSRLRNVGYE